MNKEPTKESMLNLWATMGLLVKAVSNESWKKGKNNEKTYQAIRRLIENQPEVDEKTFKVAIKMSYDAGYDKGYSGGWKDAKDRYDAEHD